MIEKFEIKITFFCLCAMYTYIQCVILSFFLSLHEYKMQISSIELKSIESAFVVVEGNNNVEREENISIWFINQYLMIHHLYVYNM